MRRPRLRSRQNGCYPTLEVFWELPTGQISLEEVARRARVSVQTVIRRFGGKDGLVAAAAERESAATPGGPLEGTTDDATQGTRQGEDGFRVFA